MKQLDEMKWEAFFLSEIFDFDKGNQNDMNTLSTGNIPLISAKKVDNGLKGFVTPNQKKQFIGHCITLNLDGDGGAGLAYYQPSMMLLDTHVCALVPKYEISKEALLFISRIITSQGDAYGHGHSINKNRLRVFRIMLPVSAPHTPDYAYMEEYMRSKEKDMLTKYKHYLEKHSAERIADELCLDSRRWKDFPLTDIFALNSTSSSIDKCKLNGQEGDYPYITRSETNNGWNSLIGKQDDYKLDDGNVISLGLDTQTVFYQHIPFYTGQNIQVLSSEYLNKYVALFIKPLLVIQMRNLNWGGNGATLGRLKKLKIMLPVTSSSTPDYAFMSKYMQNIELKQLKIYIDKRLASIR